MSKITSTEAAVAMNEKRWGKRKQTHEEAQTRRISALAEKAELETAKLRGSLIDRHRAVEQVQEMAQAERDAILAWPARAAPILAAALDVDQHALEAALNESLRSHLTARAAVHLEG
jgi:hypothetical protein